MIATWLGSALIVFFFGFMILTGFRVAFDIIDEVGLLPFIGGLIMIAGFLFLTYLVHKHLVH